MTAQIRLASALAVSLTMIGLLSAPAGTARARVDQDASQNVDDEIEHGRQLLQRHEYFDALKAYQHANQLAGGKSAEAFLGMAQAMNGMKRFKDAIDACQSAIEAAGDNSRLVARSHKLRGQIFESMGDLVRAELELRAALEADPESRLPDLHFTLGLILLKEHRDEEAIAELQKELVERPNGTTADEARALVANPRRGRERYAPEFSIVAANGQTVSLDTLRGRVVLLDFWASWSDSCRHALPSVRKIQQKYANAPFVVVSISADRDAGEWRRFVDRNQMVWPQYWDEDGKLRGTFEVETIPTYVLIDEEGIELRRVKGEGFDSARELMADIDKRVKQLSQ
jgi:tetratricopeptide (TPR) repeat protein